MSLSPHVYIWAISLNRKGDAIANLQKQSPQTLGRFFSQYGIVELFMNEGLLPDIYPLIESLPNITQKRIETVFAWGRPKKAPSLFDEIKRVKATEEKAARPNPKPTAYTRAYR